MQINISTNSQKVISKYKTLARTLHIAHYKALNDASQNIQQSIRKTIQNPLLINGRHIPSNPYDPARSRTGKLRESIEKKVISSREGIVYPNLDILDGKNYPKYLEFGTKNKGGGVKMIKRPFFYRGVAKEEQNTLNIIKKRTLEFLRNIK